jgi:large subunit ribosomal protein L25
MAETIALAAQARAGRGSRTAAKLRKQGLVPGIIYGHKLDNVQVAVSAEELDRAIRVLHARVLDLKLDGKVETVLIRELQWDHLGSEMVHVDFARVSKDETVKVVIPVKLKNTPKSTGGGVLDQPLHTLHVECLAVAIPDDITIDITNLTLGEPIQVKALTLPAGVKVLESPEAVVVHLKLPGIEPVAAVPGAAAPGAAAGTEPEVIKKEKKAEEAEE